MISSSDHMGLSAGADVREQLDADGQVRRMELFAQLYDELTGFPKPTVAACHGACVGGGAEIAVACDLRVGGLNLRLRFPGAALGVPVGPARLVTLCGLSVAKYALLTSKEIDAEMAYRWGLVHKLVPAPRTEEAALKLAVDVAAHPPEAVARIKRDAARVGRRRGPLARRGRGPGRVGPHRPRPALPRVAVSSRGGPVPAWSARRCNPSTGLRAGAERRRSRAGAGAWLNVQRCARSTIPERRAGASHLCALLALDRRSRCQLVSGHGRHPHGGALRDGIDPASAFRSQLATRCSTIRSGPNSCQVAASGPLADARLRPVADPVGEDRRAGGPAGPAFSAG